MVPIPAAAASPFLFALISLPQHVSSSKRSMDGDPEFPWAVNKDTVLLFVVPTSWVAKRKQKYTVVRQQLTQSRKAPPTCCSGSNGSSEKGGRSHSGVSFPRSNKLFFLQFCAKCQTVGHPQRRRTREPISKFASQPWNPLCYQALGKCTALPPSPPLPPLRQV